MTETPAMVISQCSVTRQCRRQHQYLVSERPAQVLQLVVQVQIEVAEPAIGRQLAGQQCQQQPAGDHQQQGQQGHATGFRVLGVEQGPGERVQPRMAARPVQHAELQGLGMRLQAAGEAAHQPPGEPQQRQQDHQQQGEVTGDLGSHAQ
jgi:hypothetical protein